jgi:hypothetical protein
MNNINPYEPAQSFEEERGSRYDEWWEGAYALGGAMLCIAMLLAFGGFWVAILFWVF